jgi:hypothetical protein
MALPASIPGNGASTVTINFDPLSSGNYAAFVPVSPNGGSALFYGVGQGETVQLQRSSTIMQLVSHSIMSHRYAGMEYGGKCYCGNNLVVGASAPLVECAAPCNDNGSQYCGAGNRLSLYSFGNSSTLVSSSMATSLTLILSTAASTSTGSVIVRTAGGYTLSIAILILLRPGH